MYAMWRLQLAFCALRVLSLSSAAESKARSCSDVRQAYSEKGFSLLHAPHQEISGTTCPSPPSNPTMCSRTVRSSSKPPSSLAQIRLSAWLLFFIYLFGLLCEALIGSKSIFRECQLLLQSVIHSTHAAGMWSGAAADGGFCYLKFIHPSIQFYYCSGINRRI